VEKWRLFAALGRDFSTNKAAPNLEHGFEPIALRPLLCFAWRLCAAACFLLAACFFPPKLGPFIFHPAQTSSTRPALVFKKSAIQEEPS